MAVAGSATVSAKIQSLLQGQAEDRIVSTVDEILRELEQQGLAYRLSIPPRLMGVHPCNRDGYGISATEVHALGSEIVSMGWSWHACSHATCIEDDHGATVDAFTAKLVAASEGLGRAVEGSVRYGSLSCGHTNRFLCAVLDEAPSTHENLTIDGRMSASKVGGDDPGLKEALEQGLRWLVLKAEVATLYPGLPDLVQRAKQATGLAQRAENEVQLLQRVHRVATNMLATDGEVDWARVATTVGKRLQSECVDVQCLIRYVRKWGGLPHGTFVADLQAFHTVYVPSGRVIPSATFGSLADLKLGPDELCPHFACAVLKAQASCPATKVDSRVCRFISMTDISGLQYGKKKQLMLEAERALQMGREVTKRANVDATIAVKTLGKLDCMMARFVLGKSMTEKPETVADVGRIFLKQLEAHTSVALDSPWGVSSAVASSAATPTIAPTMLSYDTHGNAVAAKRVTLLNQGFVEGHVVTDETGARAIIKQVNEDGAVVLTQTLPDGTPVDGAPTVVEFDNFVERYGQAKKVELFKGWPEKGPSQNPHYCDAATKGLLQLSLAIAGRSCPSASLRVQDKPVRGVFVESAYHARKLVLVPETMRIQKVDDGRDAPPQGYECRIVAEDGAESSGARWFLLPQLSDTFAVPAWAVRTSEDPKQATVEVGNKKIKLTMAVGTSQEITTVELPVLVNPKGLKVGQELVLHAQPANKPTRKTAKREMVLEEKKGKAGKAQKMQKVQ